MQEEWSTAHIVTLGQLLHFAVQESYLGVPEQY